LAQKNKKETKKKIKKNIPKGIVHIQNTFNNTIVSFTDMKGNVITAISSGALNFRGAKKSTPYAAQITTEHACEKAKEMGILEVDVKIKGIGYGRKSAIRAVATSGIKVLSIKDVTGVPHNGCRPRKRRRV